MFSTECREAGDSLHPVVPGSCDDASHGPTSGLDGFNLVLSFLSSATIPRLRTSPIRLTFQSRVGFSESCDNSVTPKHRSAVIRFNPVLGFLSPATPSSVELVSVYSLFQSRAGFSESCDVKAREALADVQLFQSRAGFSESCDDAAASVRDSFSCFNPVLGFLSPATRCRNPETHLGARFQSRAGFSESCDRVRPCDAESPRRVSIPCWVF